MFEGEDQKEGFIVKLIGLPWRTTVDEIMNFFRDSKILGGSSGVHLTLSKEGRPSGEAFVEFYDEDDLSLALKRDRDYIGNRYIEVSKVKHAEMEWAVKCSNSIGIDGCVRLWGLPFVCSKEEIAQFFTGLEIVPNGITQLTDYLGKSTGEAYVQFINKEVADKAMQKHLEKVGHRYIKIFRSSLYEVSAAVAVKSNRWMKSDSRLRFNSRQVPYSRDGRFHGINKF